MTVVGTVVVALLAASAVLTAAAFGGGASKRITWAHVEARLKSSTGSFTKTYTVRVGSERSVLMRKWHDYDLKRKFVDHRIGLGDDPDTPGVEPLPTRETPSLRFVLWPDRVLMWNPGAEEQCGTPWIEMPPTLIEETKGIRLADQFDTSELQELLRSRQGKPRVVRNDKARTVFVVRLDGAAAAAASQLSATAMVRLANKAVVGRVLVPRRGRVVHLTIDFSGLLESGGSHERAEFTITWLFQAGRGPDAFTVPESIADWACMP